MKNMKNLIRILVILICCAINCNNALAHKKNSDGERREYGIVMILPQEYFGEAEKLNKEISNKIPTTTNLPNVFHVTLFQGCFAKNKVEEIYQKLKSQNFEKIKISFKPEIKTSEGLYITWQLEKNRDIKNLHRKVIEIANPYHLGPLNRYLDSFQDFEEMRRQQVAIYGMPGVLSEYDPHATLFYFAKKNLLAEKIAKEIVPPKITSKDKWQEVASIAIVELGYVGNAERVVYEVGLE